jgi:hypothetical protein
MAAARSIWDRIATICSISSPTSRRRRNSSRGMSSCAAEDVADVHTGAVGMPVLGSACVSSLGKMDETMDIPRELVGEVQLILPVGQPWVRSTPVKIDRAETPRGKK